MGDNLVPIGLSRGFKVICSKFASNWDGLQSAAFQRDAFMARLFLLGSRYRRQPRACRAPSGFGGW